MFFVIANLLRAAAGPTPTAIPGGVPSIATVRRTSRTSIRVNGQPVLRIDLDLTCVGEAWCRCPCRADGASGSTWRRSRVGATLPAVADPANPRRFAIDWVRVGS